MLLTDSVIAHYIEQGKILIDPYNPERLGSNSYDLTLSPNILVYSGASLDMKRMNPYRRFTLSEYNGTMLEPGELYLGSTNECTAADNTLVPYIEGKSSIGRLGISVHITAGMGDIGFRGHWTLEITVVKPVRVYPNVPICQIMWLNVAGECTKNYSDKGGKYSNQGSKPVPSMMYKNFPDHKQTLIGYGEH